MVADTPSPAVVDALPAPGPAEAPPGDDAALTPLPTLLHSPVDNRSASLAVLALLVSVFMLHWASAVFIPVMLGLTLSYALTPAVDRLRRLRLPRALAAALLMAALVGATGWTAYTLSDDATLFVESLPAAAQKIREAARPQRNQPATTIEKVQQAATQLEQAAKESGSMPPTTARGVTRVQIERAQFNLKDYLWTSVPGMAASIGQAVAVLFIAFFLLASGDSFRRKMVKLAGPTFTRKKITLQALDEISGQIQRYLVVQVLISVIVGLATWLAFLAIGVEHAAVCGLLLGVPILLMLKAVCDRVDDLKPLGEMLGT
ncbi:MAG: AI-2E family transporter [Rubrivivax sp.]|nr:AI-2E family transporter [Rubrivivax sp.]